MKVYDLTQIVPQEGSIEQHLVQYKKHVDEQIPDINNSGLIIIDFESWRPIFRQNFGSLKPYKDLSFKIEQQNHPFWFRNINEAQVSLLCVIYLSFTIYFLSGCQTFPKIC